MYFPGKRIEPSVVLGLLCLLASLPALAEEPTAGRKSVRVPRLPQPPRFEAFLEMRPQGEVEERMVRVHGLIQQTPRDGAAASQRTDIYLGYDRQNLYVVFVAFDDEPDKVRANMARREQVFGDDIVEIMLDTFHDERRAYAFIANPFGVQWDALWTEGSARGPGTRRGFGNFDPEWDTLWHSRGSLTDRGYVVWMAIPFRSLRFPPVESQRWGLIFLRDIPRNNESSFWPRVSNEIEGRLNQAGTLDGLQDISPGRNMQFIPYATARSFDVVDETASPGPLIEEESGEFDIGVDAKFVFQDALVLDATVNPDFSEVESDDAQVTVNQRFEVFFPEKRPFFLENANYFRTPINLLFTRRIRDPGAGGRVTGKLGSYAIGGLVVNDKTPQESLDFPLSAAGETAVDGVLRINRDIFKQSTVGLMVTDREIGDGYNRVAAADGRFKLDQNWTASAQVAASNTRPFTGGRSESGTGFDFQVNRAGREFTTHIHYFDFSPDFETQLGFVRRIDIREIHQNLEYRFWPEGKRLISWGPELFWRWNWDHRGTRLDLSVRPELSWELRGQTRVGVFYNHGRERLRPEDSAGLDRTVDFSRQSLGAFFSTQLVQTVQGNVRVSRGTGVNFEPPAGEEPEQATETNASLGLTLRPTDRLRWDNTYLLTRLSERGGGERIFRNQILRTRLSYQFTRRLTLRAIAQYEDTDVDPARTSLTPVENLSGDLLLTYLVNPWTAVHAGYIRQDLELVDDPAVAPMLLRNDVRQVFVKFSYLIRP